MNTIALLDFLLRFQDRGGDISRLCYLNPDRKKRKVLEVTPTSITIQDAVGEVIPVHGTFVTIKRPISIKPFKIVRGDPYAVTLVLGPATRR